VIVGRPQMVNQIGRLRRLRQRDPRGDPRKGCSACTGACNIVTLKNYKDEDGVPYIPNNELWVMAKDTGKFVFFGGLKSKEFSELDNWYWHYLARGTPG
jgi:hypothetical protein